ncbi:hypothetical protein [Thiothrix fructosivorans]|uniref:Uncharacterized protein n=1 Tax=Thiothrix fructosivorans TaxID=111770 RepID=A0A8B0SKS7_9GAMM|nr:hypothetical protein [Thiothrix fructosivorans]MBO0612977.1 hypothetical protein [Thiothrix fructosivorans]QTX11574.1 hypothetical protein J1836_004265 [Thiothrix fructosivorans]
MTNDIDLTDSQCDRVLEILDNFTDKTAWAESLGLIDRELRNFLERGYSPAESCKLAVIKGLGGLQMYIPRIKTFLTKPALMQSRDRSQAFGKGAALTPSRVYQRQIADLRELTDIGGRIADKKRQLADLKRQCFQQREILRKLKILLPKELEHAQAENP